MMKLALSALLFAAAIAAAVPARAAPASDFELERVVMLMRHGIRPPTSATPVPSGYANDRWPEWPVDFGLLTERGTAGAHLLGKSDRDYYAGRGLLAPGCPAAGAVRLEASAKPRTVQTAESWARGFMPGCPVNVAHPPKDGPDPLFHGLDAHPVSFDGQRAYREALASAPQGGISAEEAAFHDELALLANVLGCSRPCPLLTGHSELVPEDHGRPGLEGPLDIASTASQTLLLEYLEGMPMKDVGWGRATRAQIEQLLQFHPLKFRYSNRTDYVARYAAAPLAREIAGALSSPGAARLTLLAGHDTNIADVGGFFGLHWQVPSYPADDVPPGSALGFELLRARSGTHYVRAFYRSQTMDQLRNQQPLVGDNRPFRTYLPIPDCGDSDAQQACTLERFLELVEARALEPEPATVH
jgi:4-phytase/acid phosphatase